MSEMNKKDQLKPTRIELSNVRLSMEKSRNNESHNDKPTVAWHGVMEFSCANSVVVVTHLFL